MPRRTARRRGFPFRQGRAKEGRRLPRRLAIPTLSGQLSSNIGRFPWVSSSRSPHPTTSASAPIGPIRPGRRRGGIVVIQEIFGVNQHIRKVCDDFAAIGHAASGAGAVRPHREEFRMRLHAGRDRQCAQIHRQPGLGRDDARHRCGDQGAEVGRPGRHRRLLHGRHNRVSRSDPARRAERRGRPTTAAASVAFADEKPKCPVQMHFGEKDASIPMTDVETIKKKRTDCESYVYPDAATASIATSAAASTRTAATLPGSARPSSSPSI